MLTLTFAAVAAEKAPDVPKAPQSKKMSSISLLPDGSQLHHVVFPRYDKNRNRVGVLSAKLMTLIDQDTITGDGVTIDFFNPDGTPRGHVDLRRATFNQRKKNLLRAEEAVKLTSDRLHAEGRGLIHDFEQGEGFLIGPAVTWMPPTNETAMNTRKNPVRAAAMGVALAAAPLSAAPDAATPPPPDTPVQAAPDIKPSKDELRADLAASEATLRAAREFLEKADVIASSAGQAPAATPPPQAPLDIKPGKDDTTIECDGGMYFDTEKGVFVYLKNVRVSDPRFSLTGADKLEIRLEKKPENPDKKLATPPEKEAKGLGMGAKFGNVQSIVATGAVRITQKATEPGKEPVQASGAIFTYHPETGNIAISGGYPWVLQGSTFMRAKSPNLTLHIEKSGSFRTEGEWEMGGNLQEADKKKKTP